MEVKLYSTPTCPYCNLAKDFLNDSGLKYEVIDVSSDENARKEMIAKSGQMGVPVFDIGGEIVTGFNRSRVSELLGI